MLDATTPQLETPLADMLPGYVTRVLAKNGVHTVKEVRRAYPNGLLKMHGMGLLRFRQIEAALFPGQSFTPTRFLSPVHHISGSSLNGKLLPVTVRMLARADITTIEQLLAIEPAQLLKIEGLGAARLREIERVFLRGSESPRIS